LVHLDPAQYLNGFYTLRLTAADVAGRTAQAVTQIEINSADKTGAYSRTDTDMTATLDGHTVAITRMYNSLQSGDPGTFGYGWSLALRDTDVESNAPVTGLETLGDYAPFEIGTRVYVTLPTGQRVGFTFEPVEHSTPGLVYYTPAFVADPGVQWTLESAATDLTRVGTRFYDLQTGQPYNPAGWTTGIQYTLRAPDGTAYEIDASLGVTGIDYTDGVHLIVSDSGIYAPNGDVISFIGRTSGISKVIGPNGDEVVYLYDAQGNLTLARDLISGAGEEYGYNGVHQLTLVTSGIGTTGMSIDPSTGLATPVTADLGSALSYLETPYSGTLAPGATDQLTFVVQSDLRDTASGSIYLDVVVTANGSSFNPAVPVLPGATLLASKVGNGTAFGLYKIDHAGLELLKISGADGQTAGAYQVSLSIAGDVNHDGKVDGTDAALVFGAKGTATGQQGFVPAADFNHDGKIDSTDTGLLFQDLGYQANRAPVALNGTTTTHEDLPIELNLSPIISDPEGDPTFYRIIGATNGTAQLSSDGQGVIFTPTAGFVGQASFSIVADDGYSTSAKATVTVNVSNASLVRINLPAIGPLLTGDIEKLQITGDFTDATGVPIPISYLTLTSTDSTVVSISSDGTVKGVTDGNAVIVASAHGIIAVQAVTVSTPDPTGAGDILSPSPLVAYPGAVSLISHVGTRQLDISTDDGTDVSSSANGTLYFTSNSEVATVSPDGLITAKNPGVATISVIFDGSEADIPINVQSPSVGLTQVGSAGGIVQGSDGSLLAVGPGVLTGPTNVDIEPLAQTALPMGVPSELTALDSFTLSVGDTPLSVPAQLAVPVPVGTPVGTTVYFFRDAQLPDATGTEQPLWLLTESGTVGADGLAHTNSPPYAGITTTGTYLVAIGEGGLTLSTDSLLTSAAIVVDSVANFGAMLLDGLTLFLPMAFGPQFLTVNTYSSGAVNTQTAPVNVGPSVSAVQIHVDAPSPIGDSDTPIITNATVTFQNTDPQLIITGQQFGTDPSQLVVRYKMGSQPPIDVTPTVSGNQLTASVPKSIVLGLTDITVVRKVEADQFDAGGNDTSDPIEFESNTVTIAPVPNLTFNITPLSDPSPHAVVSVYGSDGQTLLQQIPFPTGDGPGPYNSAAPIAVTDDLTRAYVALGSGGVMVIDTIAMRVVGEITSVTNPNLPPLPQFTTLVTSGDYLFASGLGPTIFAFNINPNSYQYGAVRLIPVDPVDPKTGKPVSPTIAPNGILDMAVNADGTKLYATVPETELYGGAKRGQSYLTGERVDGHVVVVNISPSDEPEDPALGNPDKWMQVIATLDAGLQPYRIVATGDPDRIAFTNFLDVFAGFATIQVTNENPNNFAATVTNSVVDLDLGTPTQFWDLGIKNARGLAILPDQSYAFVSDWDFENSAFTPHAIEGSQIGIIKDPFGPSPTYVGGNNSYKLRICR
jgi:hypothetical protein